MLSSASAIRHLYFRAGFGLSPWKNDQVKNSSVQAEVDDLFDKAAHYGELGLDKELHSPKYYGGMMMTKLSKEERKQLIKQSIKDEMAMNLKWLQMMADEDNSLREKMTLFWHGHFACTDPIALYALKLNNTIRKNALGNFGDMLMAVAKEPAMLRFLNNQQNKKQSPNENFAREVMELFTIGRGNYTEEDIKNGARAFTGWATDFDGNFVERPFQHDTGTKTFMGHTGNFDGDDIMKIILSRKETANFVAGKMYRYFVNQENPDPETIGQLGQKFYDADYDISVLMKEILLSDWFYESKNVGNRVKSPVELLAGFQRDYKLQYERPQVTLGLQKLLGQVLFHPPNVSGWAGGRNWIDSSSLLYRMKMPEAIFYTSEMDVSVKGDETDTAMMANVSQKMLKAMQNTTDIGYFTDKYKDQSAEQVVDSLYTLLLAPEIPQTNKTTVLEYVKSGDKDTVRAAIMRIASLPEYQLC